MKLLFLYGAPAVGKLTVARELARLTGYKLFHNHLTVDLVGSLFDFGSEQAERLSTRFRLEMFQEAALANLPGVVTFVYARGDDDAFVQQTIDAVEPHGGTVHFVLLTCEERELLRRVGQESRASFGKIRDAEQLQALRRRYDLDSPVPQRESLVVDTTHLLPQETARRIVRHFRLR